MEVIDRLINENFRINNYLSFFKKKKEGKNGPLITISREKGAGGHIVAQILAKKLGRKWDYYHRDIADEIAQETKSSKEQVAEVDEKEVPFLEEIVGALTGKEYLSLNHYHRMLLKVLTRIADAGYAVIVGRGANFLFPDALKIRIIADTEQRIKWLMQYEKLSEKEARILIKKSDKERHDFVDNLFEKDVNDPKHYDLVIKTSEALPVKDAAEVIAKISKKMFDLN